jgi:hypothetical protein
MVSFFKVEGKDSRLISESLMHLEDYKRLENWGQLALHAIWFDPCYNKIENLLRP